MAAVRIKELRSSSLAMELFFGERGTREESGGPSALYPQPQLM